MRQRFALDNGRHTAYLVVFLLFATGCGPRFKSIAPVGLAPSDAAAVGEWLAQFAPDAHVRYDLHWVYRTAQGSVKNRASIRIAPPDSLRMDFRGPFGKSGAAVVVGDSGIWAKPEGGDFQDLLSAAPLFWAALGMPRGPKPEARVFRLNTADRRAWRYVIAADTFDFVEVLQKPKRLLAEMRRAGRIVGAAEAVFNEPGNHVISSRLDFPAVESRFTFTVDSVVRTEAFGPEIWRRP